MIKKVMIIIQSLNGGGAERTASNLSLYLSSSYEVHLVVFDGRRISYPYSGMLHDLKIYPRKRKISKFWNVIKRVKAVKRLKKKYNIDYSISLMEESNIVNILSHKKERIITSIRNFETKSSFKSNYEKFVMKLVSKKSDVVVALSKGVANDLIQNHGVPKDIVKVIYNPCDGDMLRQKAQNNYNTSLYKNVIVPADSIVTMGRLMEQKGQWHLIRAFSKVCSKLPNSKLFILGEGPLHEKLSSLVDNLGLQNNVHFLGFVEYPHSFIAKCKVFAFSSLFEGLGNVLLEAMSFGLPCISTDCMCGPREIIAPGTCEKEALPSIEFSEFGVLVSVGDYNHFNATDPLTTDEEQMADAIVELLTNDKIHNHYSNKSIERSKAFLPNVIMEHWKELLK